MSLEARRLGGLRWVACHHGLAAIPISHAPRPASRVCDGAIRAFRGSTNCPTIGRCGNRTRGNLAATLEQTRHRTCPSNPLTSLSFCRRISTHRAGPRMTYLRYVWLIVCRSRRPARRAQDHMAPTEQASRQSWPPTTPCRVLWLADSSRAQLDEPERPSIAVREDCTRDNERKWTDEHIYNVLGPCHTEPFGALYAQPMSRNCSAEIRRCDAGDGSENVPIAEDPDPGPAATMFKPSSSQADGGVVDPNLESLWVEQNAKGTLRTDRWCGRGSKGSYRGQRRNSQPRRVLRRHWRRRDEAGAAGTHPDPATPVRAVGGRHAN